MVKAGPYVERLAPEHGVSPGFPSHAAALNSALWLWRFTLYRAAALSLWCNWCPSFASGQPGSHHCGNTLGGTIKVCSGR